MRLNYESEAYRQRIGRPQKTNMRKDIRNVVILKLRCTNKYIEFPS